jgi:hypothetical protein
MIKVNTGTFDHSDVFRISARQKITCQHVISVFPAAPDGRGLICSWQESSSFWPGTWDQQYSLAPAGLLDADSDPAQDMSGTGVLENVLYPPRLPRTRRGPP